MSMRQPSRYPCAPKLSLHLGLYGQTTEEPKRYLRHGLARQEGLAPRAGGGDGGRQESGGQQAGGAQDVAREGGEVLDVQHVPRLHSGGRHAAGAKLHEGELEGGQVRAPAEDGGHLVAEDFGGDHHACVWFTS